METKNQQPEIILNEIAIEHLRVTRKWSSFIAIIGFVLLGTMIMGIVGIIVAGSLFPDDEIVRFTALVQVIPIALMVLIYGIPIYYLYQFGKYSKKAIVDHDSESVTTAFHYLKLHYRFMGILIIVVMVFYLVAIIVAITAFPFISSMMHS